MKANQILFDQIPLSENDTFEFKSSNLAKDKDKFSEKLSVALSGFANSGGGFFIVGIDDTTGLVDGGISKMVGRQPLRDWIDTIAHKVEPAPKYSVSFIEEIHERGSLNENNIILIIAVEESQVGPHMAQDQKYYIRAGAHTVPARHFIVEAIRAKRFQSKPKLTYLFRLKPNQEKILQLGIVALTEAPAVDVHIQLSPLPESLAGREKDFPIKVSIVDQKNPFFFDVSQFAGSDKAFGNNIKLSIVYNDLLNIEYYYEKIIGVDNSTQPILIGNNYEEKISKTLVDIKNILEKDKRSQRFKYSYNPILNNSNNNDDLFIYVQNLLPDLINEIKADLLQNSFTREFILLGKHHVYNNDKNNKVLFYYYEDHNDLRGKIRILENCGFVYNISFNDVDRFVITEQFAQRLTQ